MYHLFVEFFVEYYNVFHLVLMIVYWEIMVANEFYVYDDYYSNQLNFDKAIEQSINRNIVSNISIEKLFTVLSLSSSWNVHKRDKSEPYSAVTRLGCVRQSAKINISRLYWPLLKRDQCAFKILSKLIKSFFFK